MRNLIITSLILLASGIFLVLWDSPPKAFRSKPAAVDSEALPVADGYMLDTLTTQHDDLGNISYTLETDHIRYYLRSGDFELDQPKILALDPDKPERPWQLNADFGNIKKRGKKIIMKGDVYAWQFINAAEKNELNSDELIFVPDQHKMSTRKKIVITTPQGITSAVGMNANLKTEDFKLLNRVRGVHNAAP